MRQVVVVQSSTNWAAGDHPPPTEPIEPTREPEVKVDLTYIFQYFATPDKAAAGVSYVGHTRAYENCRRLVARGHRVTVLTAQMRGGERGKWTSEDVDGIRVARVGVPYSQSMSYRRRAQAFLEFTALATQRAMRQRGDAVLASSPPLSVAVPALASTRPKRPMILEVRDLWPDMPISMGLLPNPALRMAARGLELGSYRVASKIIVLSPGMRDQLVSRGIPDSKIAVITNASDLEIFSDKGDPEAFLRLVPGVRDRPFALFAGSMGATHGLAWVVDLCREMLRVDPLPAVVIQGDGAMRSELIASAEAAGVLDTNLFFAPQVPKVKIADSYRAASMGLSVAVDAAGIEHNGANKFFDTLAAGRGLAINYGGWQGQILVDADAGIPLPRDPRGAAAQLVAALLDREKLDSMGIRAGRLARERFSRDTIAEQLESTLLEVVAR